MLRLPAMTPFDDTIKLFDSLMIAGALHPELRNSMLIEASEIQDWLDEQPEIEGYTSEQYGNCMPFSDLVWIEWSGIDPTTHRPHTSGMSLTRILDLNDLPEDERNILPVEAKYAFLAQKYVDFAGEVVFADATALIPYDKDGFFIPRPGTLSDVLVTTNRNYDYDERILAAQWATTSIPVALWSFSHINNRSTVERVSPQRQYRRKLKRDHDYDAKDYIYINIHETRVKYDKAGAERQSKGRGTVGRKGSFATYIDEDGRRLFGKLTGTYWRDAVGDAKPQPFTVFKLKKGEAGQLPAAKTGGLPLTLSSRGDD